MATLLLGYDVEVCDPAYSHNTQTFLERAQLVHRETGAPCTLFVCGKTLELNAPAFQELADEPLFDFQSHTYAHTLLKSNVQWYKGQRIGDPCRGQVRVLRGGSVEQIRQEVMQTRLLLKQALGADNIGLRAPTGCYMGLLDRPELLDVLHEVGIRYVSSYHLSPEDFLHWSMTPLAIQPFWYSEVEQIKAYASAAELPPMLPEILECPLSGWIDCVWKDMFGYDRYEEYLNVVKTSIDQIARADLVWSYCQHDWSSIKGDPEMNHTRAIIEYAQRKGVQITTYTDFYYRMLAQRQMSQASEQ